MCPAIKTKYKWYWTLQYIQIQIQVFWILLFFMPSSQHRMTSQNKHLRWTDLFIYLFIGLVQQKKQLCKYRENVLFLNTLKVLGHSLWKFRGLNSLSFSIMGSIFKVLFWTETICYISFILLILRILSCL